MTGCSQGSRLCSSRETELWDPVPGRWCLMLRIGSDLTMTPIPAEGQKLLHRLVAPVRGRSGLGSHPR